MVTLNPDFETPKHISARGLKTKSHRVRIAKRSGYGGSEKEGSPLRSALSEFALDEKRLMAYPNAGIPHLDKRTQTIYSQTPEEMEAQIGELLGAGAYFIGGCCGTGPEHIRGFRAAVDARECEVLAAAV